MDLWDGDVLIDAPEVTWYLHEQLGRQPLLAALSGIQYEQRATVGTFFRAIWAPTGESVLVKLNASESGATAIERLETILLAWSSMHWWAIKPFRRDDPWFAAQVGPNLERLASCTSP